MVFGAIFYLCGESRSSPTAEGPGRGHGDPRIMTQNFAPVRGAAGLVKLMLVAAGVRLYFDATIAGGFQVPSPGGKTDGGSVFGQYRRITK